MADRRHENPALSAAIGRAFAHPLRVGILERLSRGPASAGEIQAALEEQERARVDYHLRVLRECRLVELLEVRPEHGQPEFVYRASYGLSRHGS